MTVNRFLVAVQPDGAGRASLWLDHRPEFAKVRRMDTGDFYKRYADFEIKECDGDEMQRLMTMTVSGQP